MSNVLLFDSITPGSIKELKNPSSDYEYLARTSKTEYVVVRNMLEDWFSNFPASGKSDLKARFQSPNRIGFQSAFFELFLPKTISLSPNSIAAVIP